MIRNNSLEEAFEQLKMVFEPPPTQLYPQDVKDCVLPFLWLLM